MKVGQTEAGQSPGRPSGVERLARRRPCLRPETAAGRNAQVLLNSVGIIWEGVFDSFSSV